MSVVPPLMSVRDLSVSARTSDRPLTLVDAISFDILPGTMTALVGESGSGKSLTAQALLGLLDPAVYDVRASELSFQGKPLQFGRGQPPKGFRGRMTGYVMQDPSSALDPTMTVGRQIAEMFAVHRGMSARSGLREAARMLDLVRIPAAATRLNDYPHQFSGGMKQRALIAMAIALAPKLLVADEPTTALDVTVQSEILALLDDLRLQFGMAVLIITHDFGVVYQCADTVMVMYAGKLVETGETVQVTTNSAHPYTRGLISSIPDLDALDAPVIAIPGLPPRPGENWRDRCAFEPRCRFRVDRCTAQTPQVEASDAGSAVRCFEWPRVAAESRGA
jgi:oligopeptide/dipeptide ABC transporter ATP-binding protein